MWDAGTPSPPDPSPSLSLSAPTLAAASLLLKAGFRYPSPPDTSPSPNLSAPTLAAASLELKAENKNAHSDCINSVAFSPDGKTIVSGSEDQTLKVWDAGESALTPSNP